MGLRGLDGIPSIPLMPCLPLKAGKLAFLGHLPVDRLQSSSRAESSGRSHGRIAQVTAQLFRPPIFDPRKVTTTFLPGASGTEPQPPAPRRYTLTHNDITGQLNLSIGCNYNTVQVSGWYTRLIRDEVLAEWCLGSDNRLRLHVFCHVSGEERWLAPPALRKYIFQREMPLVLDTILHADRLLFQQLRSLADAAVVVHLSSHLTDLNMSVEWGSLSERASWPASEPSLLQTLWQSLASRAQPASAAEVRQLASLSDSITEQLQQTSAGVLPPRAVPKGEAGASPGSLLLGIGAESCRATDVVPQRLQSCASAVADGVQHGPISHSAGQGVVANGVASDGCSAAYSLSADDMKPERLHKKEGAEYNASWNSGSAFDQEGDDCGSSALPEVTDSRGQRSYKQSEVRGSRGPKVGIVLPEGNILEFDHGGSERRPGGMQIATTGSSVSEWLASGHEVISVRL